MDPKGAGTTPSGEGVLANFFNSLLHKKTGSPGGPGSPGSVGVSPIKNGNNLFINFRKQPIQKKKNFKINLYFI